MALVIITLFAGLLIVVGALRIILGWILPRPAMDKLDRAVGASLKLIIQISIVGLAGIIVYALVQAR